MLLTVRDQRETEKKAEHRGMAQARLMESAGQRAFLQIRSRYDIRQPSVILCGNGGNGGDGLVIARLIRQAGGSLTAVLVSGPPKHPAAALMYKRAAADAVPMLNLASDFSAAAEKIAESALIVDGVYGIGFHGVLDEPVRELFRLVSRSGASIVALDIPSGVEADTGRAADGAVAANETLAFIAQKPAHLMKTAKQYCGAVAVVEIGIPEECFPEQPGGMSEINLPLVRGILRPKPDTAHKGDAGRLLLAAGSRGYRGAAVLATAGAIYAGSGLTTLASEEEALSAVAARLPEAILLDLGRDGAEYAARLEHADACVIGCGLASGGRTEALITATLEHARCPLLVDAEGLGVLSKNLKLLQRRPGKTVLTPHIGEFAHLSGTKVKEVLSDRISHAARFAKEHGVVLVLKSENTVVATPDGRIRLSANGNAGLAKGGSGDLLAGIIGALLARRIPAGDAASAGVWLHAAAADITRRTADPYAMTASMVAERLSDAYLEIFSNEGQ